MQSLTGPGVLTSSPLPPPNPSYHHVTWNRAIPSFLVSLLLLLPSSQLLSTQHGGGKDIAIITEMSLPCFKTLNGFPLKEMGCMQPKLATMAHMALHHVALPSSGPVSVLPSIGNVLPTLHKALLPHFSGLCLMF